MTLSALEQEIVFLKAVKESIDLMVNFEMLSLQGCDPDTHVLFNTSVHQRLFNVLLVDMLSQTDRKSPVGQKSYLQALKEIASQPGFNADDSVKDLREVTSEFASWLEQTIDVDTSLPSIGRNVSLNISRLAFIKMCGNISKHNVLRATGVALELQNALNAAGLNVGLEDAMLALGDFYDKFHRDLLNYHGSTVAEFLNNIRWGIFHYLSPEFQRSFVPDRDDPVKYSYGFPADVVNEYARNCYWDLMNEVRSPPYVRRFRVTRYLKLRY